MKTRKPYNKSLSRRLRKSIKAHAEVFDMSTFSSASSDNCNTACCIGGHIEVICGRQEPYDDDFAHWEEQEYTSRLRPPGRKEEEAYCKGHWLFFKGGWPDNYVTASIKEAEESDTNTYNDPAMCPQTAQKLLKRLEEGAKYWELCRDSKEKIEGIKI